MTTNYTREAFAAALALVAEHYALTCLDCGQQASATYNRAMREHFCYALEVGGDCMHFEHEEDVCECKHTGEPTIWVNASGQRINGGAANYAYGDRETTETELADYERYVADCVDGQEQVLSFGRWQAGDAVGFEYDGYPDGDRAHSL